MNQYFTIKELTHSDTADRLHINNTPSDIVTANLYTLIAEVLHPARVAFGEPIHVSSGYRCVALNRAVGGSPTSQHMEGLAADLVCSNNRKLFNLLKSMEFDQLVWEKGGAWVHVSYTPYRKNRKQILYA